jgi:hypothetical protein
MSDKATFLKRKVPFYYQNRAHGTCGPLSICMVVDSFRGPDGPAVSFTDYEYLIRKLMDSDIKGGVPTHKITQGLEYFRMTHELIEGDTETKLKKIREAVREDCPVILNVHDSFGGRRRGHYVVVVGYDDEHLYLNDPYLRGEELNERKKISLTRFCKQDSRTSMVWGGRRWALKVTGMSPEIE